MNKIKVWDYTMTPIKPEYILSLFFENLSISSEKDHIS